MRFLKLPEDFPGSVMIRLVGSAEPTIRSAMMLHRFTFEGYHKNILSSYQYPERFNAPVFERKIFTIKKASFFAEFHYTPPNIHSMVSRKMSSSEKAMIETSFRNTFCPDNIYDKIPDDITLSYFINPMGDHETISDSPYGIKNVFKYGQRNDTAFMYHDDKVSKILRIRLTEKLDDNLYQETYFHHDYDDGRSDNTEFRLHDLIDSYNPTVINTYGMYGTVHTFLQINGLGDRPLFIIGNKVPWIQ